MRSIEPLSAVCCGLRVGEGEGEGEGSGSGRGLKPSDPYASFATLPGRGVLVYTSRYNLPWMNLPSPFTHQDDLLEL